MALPWDLKARCIRFADTKSGAQLRPIGGEAVKLIEAIGRPKSANPKEVINLRLDPDVLEHFRQGGPGWQTRINSALRKVAGL